MIGVSFMTANYVARQVSYNMTGGWGEGDRATNTYFEPIDSYEERFDRLLADIKNLGFSRIDLWTAHLNWRWATDDHIKIAKKLLKRYSLSLVSYAGGYGETAAELEKACDTAQKLGIPILGGTTALVDKDKRALGSILRSHGLKYGHENHPEKSPEEILKRIRGTDEEVVGVTIDTGWLGTHGFDAAKGIHAVRDRLFHVHLKDVLKPGAHDTCRYGVGCVPIQECVQTLKNIKYLGVISVEHEPDRYDPAADCRTNREMLEQWLAQ